MSKGASPFITKIAKATSNSDSLRTTIPKAITEKFDLHEHDVIIWTVDEKSKTFIAKKWSGV